MRIETERLVIRDFVMEDAQALSRILGDEKVMKYIEMPYTPEQTAEFVKKAGATEKPLVYALLWKETEELIGHVIFHPSEEDEYEAGWILSGDFWGKGIASETTAALIDLAKERGIHTLMLECDCRQIATVHIAEKFGFTQSENAFDRLVFRKTIG